jgi:uridine kinase
MSDVLDTCAARICAVRPGHPVRVAIDGITAAGKTTFADHLAEAVRRHGRQVVRVSMDGFHHPRAIRYRQGRSSADGYYEDAYDFDAVRRELLDPLGPGGDRRYRTAVIDLASDTPVDRPHLEAGPDAVLIVDGSFLQKPALRDAWDLVIHLRASFEAAEERGARRDADALGGIDAARAAFRDRYHAAQRRYLAECRPHECADLVVDVEDPSRPVILP